MFPFHSHNIIDNTNNGVYPGGLHTMIEVADKGEAAQAATIKTIAMKAGQKAVRIDGKEAVLPNPPVAIQGITYVPLRFIGEQLNAGVRWVQREKAVVYTTNETIVQLWLDKKQAKVDGRLVSVSAAPKQIGGSLMVPVRLVGDFLGAKTAYDKTTGEIVVTASLTPASVPDGSGSHARHQGHGSAGSSGAALPGSADPPQNQPAGSSTGAVNGDADPLRVEITSSAFVPRQLTVKKGQTVTWVNKDSQIHTVIDLQDAFISKNLLQNDSFQHTFQTSGTYTYYCSTHPSMQAEITVID